MSSVLEYLEANREQHLKELCQFLAIPSISALPEHAGDVRRCAKWTAAALRRARLENVRIIETAGNPIVYGDWLGAKGAPTVLVYGHYDVQPADPLELWSTPPFAPTTRDGKLYARGASDDKGQVFMHFKAIEAHLRGTGRLPVNVKVIVEGEEEVGGANLERFVRGRRSLLATDVTVISDGAMFDRGRPSICRGLRGLVYFQVDVRGTSRDLHSGSYGGAVANPALVLAQILARMKGEDGRIAVPGFYDAVEELTAAERAELARLPFDEDAFRAEIGAPELSGEPGYSTLERLWARPTFDVHGLLAGFTGEGTKTVIPATAMAKVSMRLVPAQDPEEIGRLFEAHLRNVAPKSVEISVKSSGAGPPWTAGSEDGLSRAAARALSRAFGVEPLRTREGGSNPIVGTFEQALRAPVVLFDLGLLDDCPHAPNEKLDLQSFRDGTIAAAFLYDEIAKVEIGAGSRPSPA